MGLRPGRLERVHPREAWPTEDRDFTHWLAKAENLALLGETIGLDLELVGIEQRVGAFRADIVCKNARTGTLVVIENQLEKTDHGHLGQLLTYAANHDAVTIVWIADRFVGEHSATLDWLNKRTDNGADFFGLEVELWRIGDSVAATFHVASQPNDSITGPVSPRLSNMEASSIDASSARSSLSPWQRLCIEYWGDFAEVALSCHGPVGAHEPTIDAWYNVAIGSSTCYLYAGIEYRKVNVRLEVCFEQRNEYFQRLLAQKSEIEAELASSLLWLPLPDSKRSRIVLAQPDFDVKNRAEWPAQHQWLLEKLTAFHDAFLPRAEELKCQLR
ncbi:MAG: DUF4268 domain-containing protein [Armatimonadota bacterium]